MNQPATMATPTQSPFKAKYDNFIGGKFVAPLGGQYFDNVSPINGKVVCQIARSQKEDIELALDAAHAAADAWGKTAPTERALILNKIADRMKAKGWFLQPQFARDNSPSNPHISFNSHSVS